MPMHYKKKHTRYGFSKKNNEITPFPSAESTSVTEDDGSYFIAQES